MIKGRFWLRVRRSPTAWPGRFLLMRRRSLPLVTASTTSRHCTTDHVTDDGLPSTTPAGSRSSTIRIAQSPTLSADRMPLVKTRVVVPAVKSIGPLS